MTPPDRTQALADQYTRIYGDEETNDHIRGVLPVDTQIIVKCPQCGLQATVARSLHDECEASGAAFRYKQFGGLHHAEGGCLLDGVEVKEFPRPRELAHA